jgi:hypothetical protein
VGNKIRFTFENLGVTFKRSDSWIISFYVREKTELIEGEEISAWLGRRESGIKEESRRKSKL